MERLGSGQRDKLWPFRQYSLRLWLLGIAGTHRGLCGWATLALHIAIGVVLHATAGVDLPNYSSYTSADETATSASHSSAALAEHRAGVCVEGKRIVGRRARIYRKLIRGRGAWSSFSSLVRSAHGGRCRAMRGDLDVGKELGTQVTDRGYLAWAALAAYGGHYRLSGRRRPSAITAATTRR